jgi:hypothetical protein
MGRGFGRGTRVAVVTHAQVKNKKKMPRGLRGASSRKKRRALYRDAEAGPDAFPDQQAAAGKQKTQVPKKEPSSGGTTLANKIAAVQIPLDVRRGPSGKLSHLRKELLKKCKKIRQNHNKTAKVRRERTLKAPLSDNS